LTAAYAVIEGFPLPHCPEGGISLLQKKTNTALSSLKCKTRKVLTFFLVISRGNSIFSSEDCLMCRLSFGRCGGPVVTHQTNVLMSQVRIWHFLVLPLTLILKWVASQRHWTRRLCIGRCREAVVFFLFSLEALFTRDSRAQSCAVSSLPQTVAAIDYHGDRTSCYWFLQR
jgi:hypothetical protein